MCVYAHYITGKKEGQGGGGGVEQERPPLNIISIPPPVTVDGQKQQQHLLPVNKGNRVCVCLFKGSSQSLWNADAVNA